MSEETIYRVAKRTIVMVSKLIRETDLPKMTAETEAAAVCQLAPAIFQALLQEEEAGQLSPS